MFSIFYIILSLLEYDYWINPEKLTSCYFTNQQFESASCCLDEAPSDRLKPLGFELTLLD